MAITAHSLTTSTYHDTTADIGTNTNRRDVSDMLDMWAHKWTPFLNKLTWGPESGGLNIEWVSEHLGYGYIVASEAMGSASVAFLIGKSGLDTTTEAQKQVTEGALLFSYNSTDCEYSLIIVDSIDSSGTVTFEYLYGTSSVTSGDKFYIIGNFANEGSGPRADRSRIRSVITNNMSILREDVQITGSMAATDMHAVDSELRHQIANRLLEMQLHRERAILLSYTQARSSTAAGIAKGCFGFLIGESGDHIQDTSQAFTESGVNDMVSYAWENGGMPDCLIGSATQLRKFTTWDRDKIRTQVDSRIAGHFITRYLTDVGIEIDLIMMRKWPDNLAFVLDSSKVKPRAKKGRKLLIEKLGKDGDRDRWQMISEFSLEFKGYDKGQHGMWTKLTG